MIFGSDNDTGGAHPDVAEESFFHTGIIATTGERMELKSVKMQMPKDSNLIIGQTHFIKSTEDLYEAIVGTVPGARFGLAFCEASGPCLIRTEGNDDGLKKTATDNAMNIGAGHVFVIVLQNAYPINVLNSIKNVHEVCTIFCATANPVEVVVAENDLGRGVMGVIDGEKPKGVETVDDAKDRKSFLRKIGYKL